MRRRSLKAPIFRAASGRILRPLPADESLSGAPRAHQVECADSRIAIHARRRRYNGHLIKLTLLPERWRAQSLSRAYLRDALAWVRFTEFGALASVARVAADAPSHRHTEALGGLRRLVRIIRIVVEQGKCPVDVSFDTVLLRRLAAVSHNTLVECHILF